MQRSRDGPLPQPLDAEQDYIAKMISESSENVQEEPRIILL